MRPRRASKPKGNDRLMVGRNVNLTALKGTLCMYCLNVTWNSAVTKGAQCPLGPGYTRAETAAQQT
jgi:hypothetical protein